jgi:hypothetical protein
MPDTDHKLNINNNNASEDGLSKIHPLHRVTVRDTAQENVMNAHGETRLFLVVVNQPKNMTGISTSQTII